MSDELRERLVRDDWMLRDVETCFESISRRSQPEYVRVCKVCDEGVSLWERQRHLRGHVRAREALRRRAMEKTQAMRLKALERAREARGR